MSRSRRRVMSYREALEWLLANDDLTGFIDRPDDPIPTVSCALVADLFGVTDEELLADLKGRKAINERAAR